MIQIISFFFSLGLLFLFTLFNVPTIESMSYNEPLVLTSNLTTNITFDHHCLMNAEMIDLEASIYSTAVILNVFFYNGIGLIFPTIIICILSIIIFQKGAQIWNELRLHHSETENISLKSNSPIVEYLRTYNAAFTFGIVFVFLSIPCKLLRLIVLFVSNHNILFQVHTKMQTIGHAFELSIYSYKCFIFICTNHRFRCALKYILTYDNKNIIINQRRSTIESYCEHKRLHASHSEDSVPFEGLYTHLRINEFEPRMNMDRTSVTAGLYSLRSSFKTRSSVSSRRTKEDEISL
jgi:hypothetical protein